MIGKTAAVYDLVTHALNSVPTPYGENVIEDVCVEIEADESLMKRYDALVVSLGKVVTNNAIGTHAKALAGMTTIKQVAATRVKIIGSYTKLKY